MHADQGSSDNTSSSQRDYGRPGDAAKAAPYKPAPSQIQFGNAPYAADSSTAAPRDDPRLYDAAKTAPFKPSLSQVQFGNDS